MAEINQEEKDLKIGETTKLITGSLKRIELFVGKTYDSNVEAMAKLWASRLYSKDQKELQRIMLETAKEKNGLITYFDVSARYNVSATADLENRVISASEYKNPFA